MGGVGFGEVGRLVRRSARDICHVKFDIHDFLSFSVIRVPFRLFLVIWGNLCYIPLENPLYPPPPPTPEKIIVDTHISQLQNMFIILTLQIQQLL